jgi:hypothetical protein
MKLKELHGKVGAKSLLIFDKAADKLLPVRKGEWNDMCVKHADREVICINASYDMELVITIL